MAQTNDKPLVAKGICDGCGETVEHWTVVKGWDLLCDPCMFKRMAQNAPTR